MKKKRLNEEVETSGENFINYISVIDSTEILNNNRSMLNFIFPDVKMNKLITWYDELANSEQYQKKEDRSKLEAINSRFYGDGTLKLLYRSLNALLTQPLTEPEKVDRDKDVKKLIRKIGTYIKQRLTDDDKEIVEKMFPALQSTDNIIEDKIEQVLLSSMQGKQEPEEKPSEETEEQPDGEDTAKKESRVNERVKNKLRKKIKEMVRKSLIDKKLSGF